MKDILTALHMMFGYYHLTVASDPQARPIGYTVRDRAGREVMYFSSVRDGRKQISQWLDEQEEA